MRVLKLLIGSLRDPAHRRGGRNNESEEAFSPSW